MQSKNKKPHDKGQIDNQNKGSLNWKWRSEKSVPENEKWNVRNFHFQIATQNDLYKWFLLICQTVYMKV